MLPSHRGFARPANRVLGLVVMGLILATAGAVAAELPNLVVVEDEGGASTLPYYRALNLLPDVAASRSPAGASASPAGRPAAEGDMLPVHSARLTPGEVQARAIRAPGLTPTFVIGDDPRSRLWLQQRYKTLRELGAVGLVVNVDSPAAFVALRKLAPGVTLAATPADDLAERLGLRHYPALITATGIEP